MKKVLLVIFVTLLSGGMAAERAWVFGDSTQVIISDGMIFAILALVLGATVTYFGGKP
jgi:hypothetical protein